MSNPSSQLTPILNHFRARCLPISTEWLSTLLESLRSSPLPTLLSTVSFRLFASEITSSCTSNFSESTLPKPSFFPPDISDASIKERRIPGVVFVQVQDIEDTSRSKWERVEELEATERGETTRGREVIRVVGTDDENSTSNERERARKHAVHKVLMKDANGTLAYGIELRPVEGLGANTNIGCKILLTDVRVARGFVLLEPKSVSVLGGKIEELHLAWLAGKKERLRAAVTANRVQ